MAVDPVELPPLEAVPVAEPEVFASPERPELPVSPLRAVVVESAAPLPPLTASPGPALPVSPDEV